MSRRHWSKLVQKFVAGKKTGPIRKAPAAQLGQVQGLEDRVVPAVFYVTPGGAGAQDGSDLANAFATIQAGIDAAKANGVGTDTIDIAGGVYNESPLIDTSVVLDGAGKNATTIQLLPVGSPGTQYLAALTINTPGAPVTIQDLSISGNDAPTNGLANTNVYVTAASSATIQDSRLSVGKFSPGGTTGDDGFGIVTDYSFPAEPIGTLSVTGSEITSLTTQGGRAFFINPGVNQFTFSGNTVTGSFQRTAYTSADSATFANNNVTADKGFGTFGYPATSVGQASFTGNTFNGPATGIVVYSTDGVTVSGNTFTNTTTGVDVFQDDVNYPGLVTDPSTVTVTGNTFNNVATPVANSKNSGNPPASPVNSSGNTQNPSPTATLQDVINAASPGDTINIPAGTFSGVTINKNLTLVGAGAGVTIINGASPALTVTTGIVVLSGMTFQTSTADPAVLVTGGSLKLRTSVINESDTSDQTAISVTGGSADLGTTGDLGGNTVNIRGAGSLISNTGASALPALGNTWQQDGGAIASNFTIEDEVTHKLDTAAYGLVTWVANNVFVTTNSGSIQRGVNAAVSGDTVNVAAGNFPEDVTVSTAGVTLLGANANKSAAGAANRALRGAETDIDGLQILAPGVTIDGLAFFGGARNVHPWGNGQLFVSGVGGVTVANSVFDGQQPLPVDSIPGDAINIVVSGNSGGLTIRDNFFARTRTGVFVNPGATSALTFTANEFSSRTGINSDLGGSGTAALVLTNNVFGPATFGPDTYGIVTGVNIAQLQPGQTVTATGNVFNTTFRDFRLGDTGAGNPALAAGSSVTLTSNSFSPNAFAFSVDNNAGTVTADNNYWGTPAGPGGRTFGNSAGTVVVNDYVTSGTDFQPGTPGFQIDPSTSIDITGDDTFLVQVNTGQLQYKVNGGAWITLPAGPVVLDGGTGDDVFVLDYTGGAITQNITFNGGANGLNGDALRIVGGALSATYNPSATTPGNGNFVVSGNNTVTFTGLEPVDYDVTSGTLTVALSGASVIDISDSTLIDTVTAALKVSGTINGGTAIENVRVRGANISIAGGSGADALTITSASVAANVGDIAFSGAGGVDSLTINGAVSIGGGLSVDAAVETVSVNASVSTDADGTAGDINFSTAAVTIGADVTFDTNAATSDGTFLATGAITATGRTLTLDLGAGSNTSLTNAANDFGTVAITSANNVTVVDVDGIILGTSTAGGTLDLSAGGAVTQVAASTLGVTGTATLRAANGAGTTKFDVTLSNAGNTFSTVAVTLADDVALNDGTDGIALGNVDAAGNLAVTAAAGITNTTNANIAVGGNASFSGTSVAIGDVGTDTFNANSLTFASAGSVSIGENSATDLAGANTAGSLTLTSAGAITDANGTSLTVTNNAAFSNGAAGITLGDDGGDTTNFGSLTLQATGGAVVISEDSDTVFANASTAGSLNLTANGPITDTGTVAVSGGTTLAAGGGNDITLDGANDFATVTVTSGDDVELNDISAIVLGGVTATTSLKVTAAGAVTQSDVVSAPSLSVSASGGINLSTSTNVATTVALLNASSGTVSYTDTDGFTVGSFGGVNGVSNAGRDVTLTGGSGGTVDQTAGKNVTAGLLTLNAATFTLTNAGNDVTGLAAATANNVQYRDASGLALQGVSAANFALTAGASVTQGSGTVAAGAARFEFTGTGSLGALGTPVALNVTSLSVTETTAGNVVNVYVSEASDLAVGANAGTYGGGIVGSGTVSIAAVGGLTDGRSDAGADVAAGTLSITAGNTIGTVADPIEIAAGTLNISAVGHSAVLTETDGLALGSVDLGAGNFLLTVNGDVTDGNGASNNLTAGVAKFAFASAGSLGAAGAGNEIEAQIGALVVTGSAANVYVSETGGFTAGSDATNLAGGVTAANVVELTSTGAITGGFTGTDVTAATAVVAGTSVVLDTNVDTLTATAGGVGVITINEVSGLAINGVTTGSGTVTLNLAAGALTDANAATNNITTTGSVSITAPGGIGSATDPIETTAGTLASIQTTNANAFLAEADAVGLGTVNLGAGNLSLSAGGSVTDATSSVTAGVAKFAITGGSLGAAGTPINLAVGSLVVTGTAVDVYVSETGGFAVGSGLADFDGSVTGTGTVFLVSTGAVTDGQTANAFDAKANALYIQGTAVTDLEIQASNLEASSAGAVTLNSVGTGLLTVGGANGSKTGVSAGSLDLNTAGSVTIAESVVATASAGGVTVTGGGGNDTFTLNAGQNVSAALDGTVSLTGGGGTDAITLNGLLSTTGDVVLTAEAVNLNNNLAANVTGGGADTVAGTVTVTGVVTLGDPDGTVAIDTDITTGTDGNIVFNTGVSTIDGAKALQLSAGGGNVTLGGAVGSSVALTSLTVTAGAGTTNVNGGSVKTVGAQSYGQNVVLGNDTQVQTTGTGNVTFSGTVSAASAGVQSLTVLAVGDEVAFTGAVGGTALEYLDVTAAKLTAAAIATGTAAGVTVEVTGTDSEITGAVTGTGSNFVKEGAGLLTLSGASSYSGTTTVSAGTLSVTGSTAVGSAVTVAAGATLQGTGTVAGTVAVDGTLSPGLSPGVLNTGSVTYNNGSQLKLEINGPTVGTQYDQVNVTGTVTINPVSELVIDVDSLYTPTVLPVPDRFTIINNNLADAVTGTFGKVNGVVIALPEGKVFGADGKVFQISYTGGDGNDVVLTAFGNKFEGTPGNDQFIVRRNASVSTDFDVVLNGNLIATLPISAYLPGGIEVYGLGGNDTFTIDQTNTFGLPISLFGGLGTDNIVFTGAGAQYGTNTYTFDNANAGKVEFTGGTGTAQTVTYAEFEPISNDGTPTNIVFNLPDVDVAGPDDVATVTDGTSGDGSVSLAGATFEDVYFNVSGAKSVQFNLRAGDDSLTFTSVDAAYKAATSVVGGAGADNVVFNTNLTLGGTGFAGNLSVDSETASIADKTLATNNGAAAGAVTFTGAVTLTGDAAVTTDGSTSDGAVSFQSTVNATAAGAESLTVTAGGGNVTFTGAVGATALEFLDVNSANDVTFTAAVTAASKVEVGDVGGLPATGSLVTGTITVGGLMQTTDADGTILLATRRNIAVNAGVSAGTGGVTISANQQTPAATTAFVGVNIAANVTATGAVSVAGTGGSKNGGDQRGVVVRNAATVSGGTGTTVTGQGGTSLNNGSNIGVRVESGGQITGGAGAAVVVSGTGGTSTGTGQNNHGVYVGGPNSKITSGGAGTVSVTGQGGASSSSNIGVRVEGAGVIASGGAGGVTVVGTGGTSTGTGQNNHGVYVGDPNSKITSGGGAVGVTGTGGTGGPNNDGVRVEAGGGVTSGTNGTVTVLGVRGGSGTDDNDGVYIAAGATVSTGGGTLGVAGRGPLVSPPSSDGVGVRVAGSITAAGTGAALTVSGTGGTGSNDANDGVAVEAGSSIAGGTGGLVTVNGARGTGGGINYSVFVEGQITSAGTGDIVVNADTVGGAISDVLVGAGGAIQAADALTINLGDGVNNLTVAAGTPNGTMTAGGALQINGGTGTNTVSLSGPVSGGSVQFGLDGTNFLTTAGAGTITATTGGVSYTGSNAVDTLQIGAAVLGATNVSISVNDGNDRLTTAAGGTLTATAGDFSFNTTGAGNDTVTLGDDVLAGTNVTFNLNAGNDSLTSGTGAEITATNGDVTFAANEGDDVLSLSAAVSGKRVYVYLNEGNNQLTTSAAGTLTATGTTSGTGLVNISATSTGNDTVTLNGAVSGFDVTVFLAGGTNQLTTNGTVTATGASGSVTFGGSGGNDTFDVNAAVLAGNNVNVNLGGGTNSLTTSTAGTLTATNGQVYIDAGAGNDAVTLNAAVSAATSVQVLLDAGTNSVTVSGTGSIVADSDTTGGGAVSVSGTNGADAVTFGGNVTGTGVSVDLGDGGATLALGNQFTVAATKTVDARTGAFLYQGTGNGIDTVTINGTVQTAAAGGNVTFTLGDSDATLGNALTVNGSLSAGTNVVVTGLGGKDAVDFNGPVSGLAVSVNLGGGANTFDVDALVTASAGNVSYAGTDGTDQVTIDAAVSATGAATFSLGDDTNSLIVSGTGSIVADSDTTGGGAVSVSGTNGADAVTFGGNVTGTGVSVDLGDGGATLALGNQFTVAATKTVDARTGAFLYQGTGNGIDTVTINGTVQTAAAGGDITFQLAGGNEAPGNTLAVAATGQLSAGGDVVVTALGGRDTVDFYGPVSGDNVRLNLGNGTGDVEIKANVTATAGSFVFIGGTDNDAVEITATGAVTASAAATIDLGTGSTDDALFVTGTLAANGTTGAQGVDQGIAVQASGGRYQVIVLGDVTTPVAGGDITFDLGGSVLFLVGVPTFASTTPVAGASVSAGGAVRLTSTGRGLIRVDGMSATGGLISGTGVRLDLGAVDNDLTVGEFGTIDGTAGGVSVSAGGGGDAVIVAGTVTASGAGNTQFALGDGANFFTVNAGGTVETTGTGDVVVNGGAGADTYLVEGTVQSGDDVQFRGFGGGDSVTVQTATGKVLAADGLTFNLGDAAETGNDTITVGADALVQAGTGDARFELGNGNNLVSVAGTFEAQTLDAEVIFGTGNDTLSVASGGDVLADGFVSVAAGAGDDQINVQGDVKANGAAVVLALGDGTNAVTVDGGGAVEALNGVVAIVGGTVNGVGVITGGSGADTVVIGGAGTGSVTAKAVLIDLYALNDGVTVNDNATVTGGLAADVTIAGPGGVTINGGAGDDTITVNGDVVTPLATGGKVVFTLGAGDDAVNVVATGFVRGAAGVTIDLGAAATGVGNTLAVNGASTVASDAGDVSVLGGSGNDTVLIGTSGGGAVTGQTGVTIALGEGTNGLTVGANGSTTATTGNVTVTGGAAGDTVLVTGTVTATAGAVGFGLGDGANGLTVQGGGKVVAGTAFSYTGGSGNDSVLVQGVVGTGTIQAGTTATFTLGDGTNNSLTVTGGGSVKAGGLVSVSGGTGVDAILVGESISNPDATIQGSGVTMTLGDNADTFVVEVTGFVTATSGAGAVSVDGGTGADQFFIYGEVSRVGSTTAGATLFGGTGADQFYVEQTSLTGSDLTLDGQADADTYDVRLGLIGAGRAAVNVADTGADTAVDRMTLVGTAGDDTFSVSSPSAFGNYQVATSTGGTARYFANTTADGGTGAANVDLAFLQGKDGTLSGRDTIDYSGLTAGQSVTVDLRNGATSVSGFGGTTTIAGAPVAKQYLSDSFWDVTGSSGADTVFGDNRTDASAFGGGNGNLILGLDGADTIQAGGGNDTIRGGVGADSIWGEAGSDRILISGTEAVQADGTVADVFYGESAPDTVLTGLPPAPAPLYTLNPDQDTLELLSNSFLPGFSQPTTGVEWVDGKNFTLTGTTNADTFDLFAVRIASPVTVSGGDGDDTFVTSVNTPTPAGAPVGAAFLGGSGTDKVNFALTPGQLSKLDFAQFKALQDYLSPPTLTTDSVTFTSTVAAYPADYFVSEFESSKISAAVNLYQNTIPTIEDITLGFLLLQSPANIFIGTNGDDTLYGTPDIDLIVALDGNDTVYAQGGSDVVLGGRGDDAIFGSGGNDTLIGGTGNDRVDGGDDNDAIFGGGNANGIPDNDTISGGFGNDLIDGGDIETPTLPSGNDSVDGGAGHDTILGRDGNDALSGNAGDDRITGGLGNDIVDGGAGNDLILGDDPALSDGTQPDADTLAGGDGDDRLQGGFGNDSLDGGSGSDAVLGDAGNDTLTGGVDFDTVDGGLGSDLVIVRENNDTTDVLSGGPAVDAGATDTLQFAGAFVRLSRLLPSQNFEALNASVTTRIYGTSGLDVFNLSNLAITAPAGLWFDLAEGDDTLTAPAAFAGSLTVLGGGGNDTIVGSLGGTNVLDGGSGDDRLTGGDLADTLSGGVGNDCLVGGGGNDSIGGGDGADTLLGGAGNDVMAGDTGADMIVFVGGVNDGSDTYSGFAAAEDRIVLRSAGTGAYSAYNMINLPPRTQSGANALVQPVDSNAAVTETITLLGVNVSALNRTVFRFES